MWNTFLQFLNQNFGYPLGGLYSNLIASGILGICGFVYGRAFEKRAEANHERRHQEILMSHASLSKKIEQLK